MPLTRRQTIQIAAEIEARIAKLAEELRGDAERARAEPYEQVAGDVHDVADEAAADLAVDVTKAEAERDLAELVELERAQKRLADGTYGVCADCGEEVEAARLLARPGAPRCLRCQQRHEKTHAAGR